MKALIICSAAGCVDEVAVVCREGGFGIEVQAFIDPEAMDQVDVVEHHRAAIADLSPRSMHAPYADMVPGSSDPLVRQVARRRFESAYATAVRIGAGHVVVHHGWVPVMHGQFSWVRQAGEFWAAFLEGKSPEVHFHLENTMELDPGLILDVVNTVGHRQMDVNLDLGHAHAFSLAPVIKWIEALAGRIGYVHVHDNHGEQDDHLPLGQGTVPLAEACGALNELAPEAIWSLEVFGDGIRSSLHWLAERGLLERPLAT